MVEDDAVQRERMPGWLERPQWIVREAANGREALNVLREEKPDVILLDLMMPEMDGFEVVAALQKDAGWRDIPVIVITSLDLNAKDRERLNSGVQSVLVKENSDRRTWSSASAASCKAGRQPPTRWKWHCDQITLCRRQR